MQPTHLSTTPAAALPALVEAAERARDYLYASKAASTRRACQSNWRRFAAWCEASRLPALPASSSTVALYLAARDDQRKCSTLGRRLVAISQAHKAAGHGSPTAAALVRETWKGIRREKGTAPQAKAPAVTADLRAMVATLPASLLGQRDRALPLLGFAGAFRRAELVGLDGAHLAFGREGLTVTLRRSKTDQEGQGRQVGIPYGSTPATCPVRAVQGWLAAAGIGEGALFRAVNRHGALGAGRLSARAVALVVKRSAQVAGLDPARYAGHSLRAGLATSAAAAGVPERAIMAQTGHRSLPMLRRYIREGSLFRGNAAAAVGL